MVCGIDCGSTKTLSYVAWLDTTLNEFMLDAYIPDFARGDVLPKFAHGAPAYVGLDCPQGLPNPDSGRLCRKSDQIAKTPTKKMAMTRGELETGIFYGREIVRLGIDLFWTLYSNDRAAIYGLSNLDVSNLEVNVQVTVFETYPRYALETLFGLKSSIQHIPSKRKDPLSYIQKIWSLIQNLGYTCQGGGPHTVDDVDAMLCAIAAEQLSQCVACRVGNPPSVDHDGQVLREGYIVVPTRK